MYVFKVGVAVVRLEPFALQAEAPGLQFPVAMGGCAGVGVSGKPGSQPLLPVLMWLSSGFARSVAVPQPAQRTLCTATCRLRVSMDGVSCRPAVFPVTFAEAEKEDFTQEELCW